MHPLIRPLTAAILTLLSAGCTDTSGGSVDSPTPHKTAEPTEYPTPIETAIESQHLYDINPDKYGYIKIDRDDNLFGIEIEGSKVFDSISSQDDWIIVYNNDKDQIFQRETYTPHNFDLYSELPGQARTLEAEYGQLVKLTREEADLNPKGDGQLDTVKIKYEDTQGSFTYESNVPEKGTTRLIWDFMKEENLV